MSLPAILAVLLLLSPFSLSASYDDTRSAYDVIQDFNFPMGILPKGVTGYDLDRSNGNGDDLNFSVGIASASFPIDNFYECPQCGCGLNCSPAPPQVRKIKMKKSLVSSI
ncbi:hypothetical protein ACLB2K_014329 [Fragaria x ananassa]